MPPNAVLSVDISDNYPKNAVIEPMILITFIANAFKHGLTTKQPCEIFISIKFQDNDLLLKVENPVLPPKGTPNDDVPGIGLSNTQTRLQYAYPEKHVLKINNDGKKHVVELNLELKVLEQVHLLKSNVPNPENYLNPDIR